MKIKVLNETLDLSFTDLINSNEEEGCLQFFKKKIMIDEKFLDDPVMLMQVLWHEILHYIVKEQHLMDIKDEETFVNNLAISITMIEKDNKKLFEKLNQ